MKNFWLATLLLPLFLFVQCSKEENPIDDPEPISPPQPVDFQIILEGDPEVLHLSELISVPLDSFENIVSVKYLLGDTEISSTTEYPFEFTWQTTNVEDGEYRIKAVVEDQPDNISRISESFVDVVVKNVLFIATIPEGFVTNSDNNNSNYTTIERWLYLTSPKGELIGEVVKVEDNNSYEW
jgi:hypothetical protein